MKQSIKFFSITALLLFGLFAISFAQNMYANNLNTSTTTSSNIFKKNSSAPIMVSSNTQTKFLALFPKATQAIWTHSAQNSFVSFIIDEQKATACFNSKGQLNYAITHCSLNQLPLAFGKIIKKDFSGYQFFHAKKIFAHQQTAYRAILENATNFITLTYTNTGVEILQTIKKATF